MQKLQNLSIGFTSYRLEILPLAKKKMLNYQAILLEEPHTPGFQEMLSSELSLDDYLQLTDFEFPNYALQSCKIYQELYQKGKTILQIDPFMDELVRIHEFFAAQGKPEQITSGTITRKVYEIEREWTGRLLNFYRSSGSKDFNRIVKAVKDFAQIDAQKGRLRNKMRAEAIANLFQNYGSIYVEAGYIHISLMRDLLRLLPQKTNFYPIYLMKPIVLSLSGRRQVLGPGDVLTLIYTFKPNYDKFRADLLAAQSLIYNKIIYKEEINNDLEKFPHTKNEIEAIGLATSLNYEQCQKLFNELKILKTSKAREYAKNWVSQHLS